MSSRLEQVAGSYESGNESSDFIKSFMHITLPFYLLSYPIPIEGYCDIKMPVMGAKKIATKLSLRYDMKIIEEHIDKLKQ